MKRNLFLCTLFVLPVMMLSCGGDSLGIGKYAMSKLPSKFAANIPNSLKDSTSSSSSLNSILRSSTAEKSEGCAEMKTWISTLTNFSGIVPLYALLADAAISKNSISPDGTTQTCSVTFTEEMYNAVSDIFSDDMGSDNSMSEYVGISIPLTIVYQTETSTTDAPYDYSVAITMDGETSPTTIYWSTDKTKTKLSGAVTCETQSGSSEGDSSSSTSEGTLSFTYDSSAKSMVLDLSAGTSSMSMCLKEQGSGSIFYLQTSSTYTTSTVTTTGKYVIEGYADDNGGYVKMTTTSGATVTSISENFDANGYIATEESTYGDTYDSQTATIVDFQTSSDCITITSGISGFDAGNYLVLSDNTGEATASNIIGQGTVYSGKLVIMDIGGAVYSTAVKGYLYKITAVINSSSTVATTASGTVTITR